MQQPKQIQLHKEARRWRITYMSRDYQLCNCRIAGSVPAIGERESLGALDYLLDKRFNNATKEQQPGDAETTIDPTCDYL